MSFDFKTFFKTIAHVAATAAAVTAAQAISSGAAITSGNVLLPALGAAGAAVFHALVDSFSGPAPTITVK